MIPTIVIATVLAGLVFLAVRKRIRDIRKNRCCGSCGGCPGGCSCVDRKRN